MEYDNFERGFEVMEQIDNEPQVEYRVERLAEGLGYGEGSISTRARQDVEPEVVARVEAVIENREVLVEVDRDKNGEPIDDDGCGDGRGVKEIWEGAVRRLKSLRRAKVFGAGVAMEVADEIGSGRAIGRSLQRTFLNAIDTLKSHKLNFGGHTSEHVHGSGCGCGAIDEAPSIIKNAVKYQTEITSTINVLGVDSSGLDEIFQNYMQFDDAQPEGEEFNGAEIMAAIRGDNRVVKQLEGDHKEWFIILNYVEGKTIDQDLIRTISGGKIQAFAVDVWRLRQIAAKLHPDDLASQQQAMLSKLVYTLSVAATLTPGDLPVYRIMEEPALVAA